jgi:hypothetical protein
MLVPNTAIAIIECEAEEAMSSDLLIPDMECIWYDSLADDFS